MVYLKFCKTIHLPSWPAAVGAASSGLVACDGRNVVAHGVRDIASCATTLCSSVVGHGGSRPASVVSHGARIWPPILHRNSAENVIIIRKNEREGKEDKGVRRRW
jgi:hypothetical protein